MPQKSATIRDIAAASGVSVATVSRVINGAGNVRDSTRDRVMAQIAALDFVPSRAAVSLATSRTRTIGAVVPFLENSIFARYLHGVERTLAERGYSLVISVSNSSLDDEARRVRELLNMGAEGLLLTGATHAPALSAHLAASDTPVILTSIYADDSAFPTMGYDNAEMARIAVAYLADKGARQIGVLHGPEDDNDRTRARMAGAESAGVRTFVRCDFSASGGATGLGQLQKAGCDAALCLSDILALGALFESTRLGIRVPQDMAVMGFDNLDWSGASQPQLTTLDLPVSLMAQRAAGALVDWVETGARPAPLRLDGTVLARTSA